MKITAIKQQVKRSDRYSIFVDGAYAFSLSEAALLASGLASGKELDKTQLKELKKASGNDKAFHNALRYVSLRPRSEWEMRTYLTRKQVDEPVVEDILRRLRASTLLDDQAFARSWITNRHLLKNTSKRRLRLELKQKGIAEDVIEQALAEDEVTEQENLAAIIAKKRARYPDTIKLTQYLLRQGFNYADIKTALSHRDDFDTSEMPE
jgi:regulatory protein